MDENALWYAKTHEWLFVNGNECQVGITRFAIEQLKDITYIELPPKGASVRRGEAFGVIESVKAASDLYSPVTGEVIAVNPAVSDDPAILSQDAYEKGWMIRVKVAAAPDTSDLLTKAAYDQMVANADH